MATTTTTSTNTGGIANSLNTPARADEDGGGSESFSEDDRDNDVSVDCGTIGSSYDEEHIQVYRERILVGGSFFPPDNSESGSGRREWNGMLLDISSLFPATKSETDSSSLFSRPNSNSIMAIFPPHRSTDGSENGEIIIARNPSTSSLFPAYFSDTASSVSNETRLDEWLVILGIEKLSISEIEKLEWNLLNGKMKKWIQTMKIILSGLGTATDETKEICFNETVKGCVMQLLNFGKAVAIGRRPPEMLFRILDMYDVMAKALARLEVLITYDVVINEAREVLFGLGEAACGTFAEFENAVKLSVTSEKPMQSGKIHPLTRYVINYVKLIVDYENYSETLNLFLETREDDDQLEPLRNDDSDSSKLTPVARRLLVVITSLHSNLEEISKLYEDGALQYIFLMNNILYVVQKVKVSGLRGLLGDNWVRKQHGQITQYAMSYLRASWTKVLDCLNIRGTPWSLSSKASTVALQERLKNFNACFEEIYSVQTAWIVPDAQLRGELRISILEKVIPAYRLFMGRFGNKVESGRHAAKYIEYSADDLENYLSDLFNGIPRPRVLRTLESIKPPVRGRVKRRLFLFNKA